MYDILRDGVFFAQGTSLQAIADITGEDVSRYSFTEEALFLINKAMNQPIYDQLIEIDNKSIRALRTNDVERLTALEAEAEALRLQLLPTE